MYDVPPVAAALEAIHAASAETAGPWNTPAAANIPSLVYPAAALTRLAPPLFSREPTALLYAPTIDNNVKQLCERQLEALEEAKRKEKAKSFACRVTIVEGGAEGGAGGAGRGGGAAARERYGTGYFTLDEDF